MLTVPVLTLHMHQGLYEKQCLQAEMQSVPQGHQKMLT